MTLSFPLKFHRRYASLPTQFYTRQQPEPLDDIELVVWNSAIAKKLGFPPEPTKELVNQLSGSEPLSSESNQSLAMKYAGHQFGVYNPDLGDGRGLLLTEIEDNEGVIWDVHLKGAGRTPYSRMGDGRAVLRSTIREYLGSEALSALGIPTTRALAMMSSQTPVYRESKETGAMLLRIAKTHIRFGHFEHFYYTQQHDELKLLADSVIEWLYPECAKAEAPYDALFTAIVKKTAHMIALWQAYGFCHGVMNTDNMSIIGDTFDYGPYAFLDDYDPNFICNHSDYQGRYSFSMQPRIALWNLTALAQAFSPLIEKTQLEEALASYDDALNHKYSEIMRKKFGLIERSAGDGDLISDCFALLEKDHVDHTRFFRQLSMLDQQSADHVIDLFVDRVSAEKWINRYILRCESESNVTNQRKSVFERCDEMRAINPKYILRNYLAQQAISLAEEGDYSEIDRLLKVLSRPFDEQPEFDEYAKLPPDWGKHLEISCSS
ncbi:protein adenylyltransferase SelO [Vibrio viridaestus]|uniref:Protein nucleotidyltransferase YdiU n=1 Tax=Vibrio viridaestus TaxID=2487322 RepID=A0A3N9TGC0_9VIBR|nr:YdiU family protein [Vibrio viridaestus]RQW63209.1 YdiU family protein [Vibrio viridaestus]